MLITSLNNEKIKELSKLHLKKYREESKLFLVEGDHLLAEAFKSGFLKEIIALEDMILKYDDIPVTYVTSEVMKKLSLQDSSTNIIGVCKMKDNVLENKNLIILDAIQDPGNLGTIIRSAAAFNYDVVLGDNTVDIYNEKTIRSTEGMIFHVNFIKENVISFINNHDEYEYFIADMDKGNNIKNITSNKQIAFIMGNEGNGVSSEVENLNLSYIHINQSDLCESLNVGVAASILMFEKSDING